MTDDGRRHPLSLHALAARCVATTTVADKLALTADVAARFDSR